MYLERVVRGEAADPGAWLIRAVLWPLSLLYSAGLSIYLALRLRKRTKLGVPVISVGNLTFGGTGKTPAVQAVCRMLQEMGRRVVVLSRGHGGSATAPLVVSDGQSVAADSENAGDEPVLLARCLSGVPVVVGKDRRASGKLACERFRPDVIVLDDGLQYWQLDRDLDIVVLDAAKPFGSGLLMPAGDLREPPRGVRRAGVVLVNNSSALNLQALAGLRRQIERMAPGALILSCDRVPDTLTRANDGSQVELTWLAGRSVAAFCGIGRPQSFEQTLASLGASLVQMRVFADHHRYTEADLAALSAMASDCAVEAVVTTQKDYARLGRSAEAIDRLYVLNIRLQIEDRQRLARHLADRCDRSHSATSA